LEAEGGGLFAEVFFAAETVELFLGGEGGGGVRDAVFDQMMEDAREFVGGGGAEQGGALRDGQPKAARRVREP
jgi:hypothetical protein